MNDTYECDGQIKLTDYLKSQISDGKIMDLTNYINSQGKAQYMQIGEVISTTYEREKDSEELLARLTNDISVWVLRQSVGYMEYLTQKSSL